MSSEKIIDLRKKKPGKTSPSPETSSLWQPQKRVSPVRTRRRRTRLIVAGLFIVFVIVAAFGISYASYLPRYTIQKISVEGAQATPAQQITDYVNSIIDDGSHHFLSRANIFLYPRSLVEKDIVAQFPRISTAVVSRDSLTATTLDVAVTERQTYALWCPSAQQGDTGETCYQMDQSGFIFAAAPPEAASTTEYVFYGGVATSSNPEATPIGQTFAPGHMPGMTVFLQLLGQAGFSPLGATVESDEDFTVPLAQGFSIDASFGEDAGQLVNNLQLVLSSDALQGQEQDLEYVDLRFGDRVYYKLKGGQQQVSQTSQ